MSFAAEFPQLDLERLLAVSADASHAVIDRTLAREPADRTLDDLAVLLSPRAGDRLEELARASRAVTVARFGRTMRMYAPLYLSNECLTTCTYCGFAKELPIVRKTLSIGESAEEARHLVRQGFRSVLLLTGEHERNTGVPFLVEHIEALAEVVPQLSIEVQVWSEDEYLQLAAAGCEGTVIYQETYHPQTYARVHIAGRKRHFDWRLEGPERAARAGMRRIGIGALFGLHDDWRYETLAVAAHARSLQREFWRSQVNVSVPRIRPSASGFAPAHPMSDRELAQVVCALRLMLPDAGLVLSTRESAAFRDGLFPLGITHASAGSHTEPGGYEHPDAATQQFEIADMRPPNVVAARLRELGFDPVWEDWARITPATERALA